MPAVVKIIILVNLAASFILLVVNYFLIKRTRSYCDQAKTAWEHIMALQTEAERVYSLDGYNRLCSALLDMYEKHGFPSDLIPEMEEYIRLQNE
jgi:hypothetical protein